MTISPARTVAFDVLSRIESDRAFSSILLPQYEANLASRDRALCHELVLGVLRRQIFLDRIIGELTRDKKLDIPVRVALRLGLYQLGFLDKVPHHAAVNESVELVQRVRHRAARSLVNAVLRRFARVPPTLVFEDETEELSVKSSHPRWLIERWVTQYGVDTAQAIAYTNNDRPKPVFRLIDETVVTRPAWEPSPSVPGAFTVHNLDAELLELAGSGRIYFQDEASQLVATSVAVPSRGSLLDVCAAPGGKTGMIARGRDSALIVAGDLLPARVMMLKANLVKQRCARVRVLRYNAEAGLPFADATFDTLLVDAPCSGTGTIRHNPEIRYVLTPEDPIKLSRKQQRILANASKVLKPGGTLIYSTCSFEREEGEDVVRSVVAADGELSVQEPAVPREFLTTDGFARTWPHRDGMDGFFIACLVKRGV